MLKNNFEVIIAADNYPLQLLRLEFPDLEYIKFPSYQITYTKTGSLTLKMFLLFPAILFGIYKEHRLLNKIVKKYQVDIVISDNRFGLWNKNVFTVFITHQLCIKMPGWLRFAEYPVHLINKSIILKYNKCWIPDYDKGNKTTDFTDDTDVYLSGDLSHKYSLPDNAVFIGALSRFSDNSSSKNKTNTAYKYDILAIISGPEPQRTIFEDLIINQLKETNYKALIIRGRPISRKDAKNAKRDYKVLIFRDKPGIDDFQSIAENIKLVPHLSTVKIKQTILSSDIIICRSGYSNIMDLITLNKKAILLPTPGQTEQEYLAKYYKEKGVFYSIPQDKFNIKAALDDIESFRVNISIPQVDLLDEEVKTLMFLVIDYDER